WVLGEYPLPNAGRVTIGAAIGIAEWRQGRSAEQLFAEADAAMYSEKRGALVRHDRGGILGAIY
ncbi:MAG TPA: hypothetical protein VNV86_02020, partial [Candidatus Acidoferrum sp.]|nr:hypothetical protein [Candidatus Acidoferrum sp.]